MGWSYVFKRILLIFPSILVVLLLAFLLKNAVPGDPVESILINRGMTTADLDKKQKEYNQIYLEEKLDKALFYFSVVPDYYPNNISAIVDPVERDLTRKLMRAGYDHKAVQNFINLRTTVLASLTDFPIGEREIQRWKQIFTFENDPGRILDFLLANQTVPRYEEWRNTMVAVVDGKRSFFYPVLLFHGADNQFHHYLEKVVRLDFGTSIKDGQTVMDKIKKTLPWSLMLVLFSMVVLFSIAIPLGLFSGRYEGSRLDTWTEKISILLYAIPVFWLASMLIVFCTTDEYSRWLNIFPSVGTWYQTRDSGFFTNLIAHGKQLILPVICLVANDFAFLIKLVKENTRNEKQKTYVKVAIAKGLPDRQILFNHVFPNVGVNILAIAIGIIPAAFAGSLIIEVIFNIPGMGRLLYDSIAASDWKVVFGILVLLSCLTLIFNLVGDLLFARLNPMIRYDQE